MDESSLAHALPELYRSVLDHVATLEQAGHRREAHLVRCEAIRIYSRSWDARAMSSLEHLRSRAGRVLAGRERPRRVTPASPALRLLRLPRADA